MKNILKTFAIAASVDKRDSVDTRSTGTGFICPIIRSYDIPRKSGR